jgi:D-serine deaminase-like pyridoxal phosphate-dependent protein
MHTQPGSLALLTRQEWFAIKNIEALDTPALLVYPNRVRDNIRRAVLLAGDPGRLRPHMKTSKCAHVCQMMMEEGIHRFKCATIAEAEMMALCGAPDVLLAYQPVGPKVERLMGLIRKYPATQFSCLVDHPVPAKAIAAAAQRLALHIPVYVDINAGMNRTGIQPGTEAVDLYLFCQKQKGIEAVGFHVYDGHIMHADLHQRRAACEAAFEPVEAMRHQLQQQGLPLPLLVAGGTPTFLIHAQYPDRQCSPGTFVYWDASYQSVFPEMPFIPAALVATRVVSQCSTSQVTVDLGHKAVASENDLGHRVHFLNAPDAALVKHSEEHGVLQLPEGHSLTIGDVLFGLPHHICPTVSLYEQAYTVEGGIVTGAWATGARNRTINI